VRSNLCAVGQAIAGAPVARNSPADAGPRTGGAEGRIPARSASQGATLRGRDASIEVSRPSGRRAAARAVRPGAGGCADGSLPVSRLLGTISTDGRAAAGPDGIWYTGHPAVVFDVPASSDHGSSKMAPSVRHAAGPVARRQFG